MATQDTHLERQLSSLFRAEAGQTHLPLGTWQSIAPRLGEQDGLSLFRKLLDAMELPVRWRNPMPMKMKYVAPSATAVLLIVAAILFVLLINSSSDDSGQPVPLASPTVVPQETTAPGPTATAVVATPTPVATPVPEPTNTPEPTATAEPEPTSTPEPTAIPTREPTPTPTPIAFPPGKEFPEALRHDSEPLPEEEVIALWTEFLTDTHTVGRVVSFKATLPTEPRGDEISQLAEIWLCSDGTGLKSNVAPRIGNPFTWEVSQTLDGWNRVAVRFMATPGEGSEFLPAVWFQWFGHDENGLFSRDFTTIGIEDISDEGCSFSNS